MLKELGITRCAYDWREEHVPTFEQEILEYKKHGIEYFAFWSTHEEAFRLFEKYDLHPQIWQMMVSLPVKLRKRKLKRRLSRCCHWRNAQRRWAVKLGTVQPRWLER